MERMRSEILCVKQETDKLLREKESTDQKVLQIKEDNKNQLQGKLLVIALRRDSCTHK